MMYVTPKKVEGIDDVTLAGKPNDKLLHTTSKASASKLKITRAFTFRTVASLSNNSTLRKMHKGKCAEGFYLRKLFEKLK